MKKTQTFSDVVHKIECAADDVKITALRKDILKIIFESKNAISAYSILARLKKIRSGSEPPTVYRVIDYFLEKKIIHKIDSENTYILCSHLDETAKKNHGVLLTCSKCSRSSEVYDEKFFQALEAMIKSNQFKVECPIIQIKGICANCL